MTPRLRARLDRFVRALARWVLGVFFREVRVVGAERVPADGPVVFVANHGNSLVDPFVLTGFLPRPVRFLAKSTLWQNPAVRPLLQLAGSVPVHRRVDGGDMRRNEETFTRCHDELAGGGCVALFPEGLSHHEPALQPLKTGAARIALGAERARGPLGLRVVPVGLVFEAKALFRSRVLVQIGEPIAPPAASAPAGDDAAEREAVRALTARIDAGLRAVTLNHESWEEARLVERAVQVWTSDERDLPGDPDLEQQVPLRRAFARGAERWCEKDPERVEQFAILVARYDALLGRLGLRDDQIAARYPWTDAALYVTDRLPLLVLWLPAAVVGTALNYLPYRASGFVADRYAPHPDTPSTYKLLTGFFGLPVVWALEAAAAAALWGFAAGLAVALLAPASGWLALRFHERNERFWNEVRAFAVVHLRTRTVETLRELRRTIRREVDALAADP